MTTFLEMRTHCFVDTHSKLGIIGVMKQGVKQANKRGWHTHLTWLKPGLGVKRWLIFLILGVGLLSLGGAVTLRALYPLPTYFYYLTLQFLPRVPRAIVFVAIGLGIFGYGLWGLNNALLEPFLAGQQHDIPTVLFDYHRRKRGPKIVVIGGGHGQASTLRGLKAYTSRLTAIVTVADDGGSSGRLRKDMGILPPGDFRNCIAALADDESLITRLFQYRFASGADLRGHSFGNLFISAMAGVTGSFEGALRESSQVLAVQGRVLPCTLEAVTLCADIQVDGQTPIRIRGESQIPEAGGKIMRVNLEPEYPRAYPETVRALLEADLVVIGPGSLYTSIMPNLLVPEIVQALHATRARVIYVCNVATQPGETDAYTAQAHVDAVEQYIGSDVLDAFLVNTTIPPVKLDAGEWVKPDIAQQTRLYAEFADLADVETIGQHDSAKLAHSIWQWYKIEA